MKIKIPVIIRIGAYDFKTIYVPDLLDDYRLLGQSLADKQKIKIEPSTSEQTKLVTFWHEVIHGINETFRCELDEKNVDRIAQGIAAILRNDFGIEFDWSDIK